MSLPPLWKVRRELNRIVNQITGAPRQAYDYQFATRRYDTGLRQQIRRFDGALPEADRVAIYLIYPSAGLLWWHERALRYLHDKGYATLVVSNLPLSEADRARLLPLCWRYLERPNFGYDFGGYRDAVLELGERLADLQRLVILNDSVWFPLPGARDWLDDVEALDVDFAGAASNYGTPRPEIEEFATMQWSYRVTHPNFHYCSFALCVGPAILRDPGFLRYWKGLRLSNDKSRTVRRGEIGLSQWVLSHGYRTAGTLDVGPLDQELAALSDAELRKLAVEIVIPEDRRLVALQGRLLAGSPSREELIRFLLLIVSRQGSSYALAPYSIFYKGYPFLKKSPVWLCPESSEATMRIAERIEGEGAVELRAEIEALRVARKVRLPSAGCRIDRDQV